MSSSSISCEVAATPHEIDAGAEFALSARIVCTPSEDLRGRIVRFLDTAGEIVAEAEIVDFDGQVNISRRATARAPDEPGTHGWSAAVSTRQVPDGRVTAFDVVVTDHATRVVVWDVPPAIEAGTDFPARIGLKCSSGCDMSGRSYIIRNAAGDEVAAGQMAGAIWPGSDGLFFTEIDLPSPAEQTLEEWTVEIPADNRDYPHRAASCAFRVRTVPAADCLVEIEAVDDEKGEPLANMSVVMHPYRGRTDERGIARINVARGSYSIFVSGRGYYPVQRDMKIERDVATLARLEAEPPQSADW